MGRSGGGGPLCMLMGAASSAMQGGGQRGAPQQESYESAPHAGYGSSAPYGSNAPAPAPYGGSTGPAGDYGASEPAPYAGGRRRQRKQKGGPLGMVKRVMQEDVLYLMIVNMPSEGNWRMRGIRLLRRRLNRQ